jgi:outer membrane protein assembly factor BamD (BamD/ComL family)
MTEEANRQLKVFLCHASGDKPPVRELYKRLLAEGVDAWLDQEKLLPGQDWGVEIPRAVRDSDVVVICLSNSSITKEGYVQKEIRTALDAADEKPEGTIFLIPARLEDCTVPERLDRWQWVDLFEENGFMRLLRSLKLRADKVGAVIQPPGYEDSDSELEHRLDQLYTEGLAAFWVEDWDRACQRFQTILRERPGHKNAAEKLAQAERQRNLANLYAQATAAYESENWLAAIQFLEKLLEKSGDYKDAVQLLKGVKKQRQLRELYTEAKRLHAAQKWQAVLKVFEQITAIEPTYPDPDRLLPSAQQEAAELKRLGDLSDLYQQGVHKMDSGEWYEARSMLEQVHKAQIDFLDTERLLRKVEDEIGRMEELNKRRIQVDTLYEQVERLTRSRNWQKASDVIEEIRHLDDQFVDQRGIFEKVKTELAQEQREAQQQKELGALYAEAVSLLQAKKYQEALEKWNAIQAIDPNYKDTARVRKTAKRKLDELAQTEAAGQSWRKTIGNWFSSEANIPIDRIVLTEKLLLVSFALAVFSHVFIYAFQNWLQTYRWESVPIGTFAVWTPLAVLYGSVVAFTLNRTIENWRLKHSLILVAAWALGFGISWVINTHLPAYLAGDHFIVFKLLAGLSIIVAIKRARPATQPISLLIILLAWYLALSAGEILGGHLTTTSNVNFNQAGYVLSILLGLLFTFGMQVEKSWEVLRTALFGALGFAIGNYLLYLTNSRLSFPPEITFALWGLIGGAILEAPSRDSRRIVISAAVGGIGLLVGSYVAYDILPLIKVEYANITLSDKYVTLQQLYLGIGLGLALGLLIRRSSASGVLAVLGAGIYMITRALNQDVLHLSDSWENLIRGALIGFVLGYGYGYLRKVKLGEIPPHPAKSKWVWVVMIGLLAIAVPVVIRLSSPPGLTSYRWNFTHSSEGWGDYHDLATPAVGTGLLKIKSTGLDPSFESPSYLVISASETPVITLRMRIIQGQGTTGQIFFTTNRDSNWSEAKSVLFALDQGSIFHTYNILMAECPAWQGTITKIRLDPVGDPTKTNIQFEIDYVSVHAP